MRRRGASNSWWSCRTPFEPSIKSHFWRICQLLAINAHKMAPRPHQRLQDRTWDAPTKGLLWQVASEGGFKLVVELQDKQKVETVVIRHHHESSQKTRYTVCVSSQVRISSHRMHLLNSSRMSILHQIVDLSFTITN